jgi:hypothetical protein
MKKLLHLCGSLGVLGFCLGDPSAQAQDFPPLPSGPLLQKMADYSAVQITYSYPEAPAKPAPGGWGPPGPDRSPTSPIRQLTLTRTKPIWHALRIDIYGNTMGEWYTGRHDFYEAVGFPEPLLHDPSPSQINAQGLPDFRRVDFPDMDWVSSQTYAGVESVGGRQCLIFKKNNMTAWIDLESRLPVQWQQGGEIRTFQQLPPPTEPLVLPPKIAKIAAALNYDHDKWEKMVVRPQPNQ